MIRRLGVLVLVLASGCTLTRVDIAGKPQYPTDYAVGQVLRLKQALILERPGGTLSFSPPCLLKDARDTRRVIGVVESGTTLRVTRIMRGRYPGLESWGEVNAEILSGPYRGREVEITAISRQVQQEKPPVRVPWIDPNLLQRVEE
jgi:hypothetical protein